VAGVGVWFELRYPPDMFRLLSIVLLAAAPAPASDSVAGVYQSQQMEIGAALELRKDGHFRYQLDYGAVSEGAEGDWTFDGKTVRLTSKPMPKAPSFELVRDDPAPSGELYMTLEDPGFEWGHGLEAIAKVRGEESGFEISAGEGGRVDLTDKPPIEAIAPLMPVYGPTGDIFPLRPDRGHKLLIRFHRNELGKAAFRDEPLTVDGTALVLSRYDARIRFLRARP
jgi:hypothetical protein